MARLELQDVSFAYGPRRVVEQVSLAPADGTTTAIVGPNGAGKTTLLSLAGGLLEPAAGRVLLEGHDLVGVPRRAAARRIAAVPAEEEAVFPFPVRETVLLGRHPWRGAFRPVTPDDERRVDDAIARAGLTHLAHRPVTALSSGERQRVAIARCLVQDAGVVLLDEPTAHLDLGQRMRMLALFRSEAREHGRTVIAVLHDLNLAAAFADRIVLLVGGRVLADGPPAEVITAEHVAEAFGTPVRIVPHPEHGAPFVMPLQEAVS